VLGGLLKAVIAGIVGTILFRARGEIGQEVMGLLDRYNAREEAELQAWVRGVKRIEARRSARSSAIEADLPD